MQPLNKISIVTFLIFSASFGFASFAKAELPKERVTGFGGFFFKAKDPKALAQWYEANLGVVKVPSSEGDEPWEQEKGPTAFAPFPKNTSFFGAKDWMLNFRVKNLDAMVKQLTAAGIKVTLDPKEYPYGRFASLEDPDGNPIQLWENK